MYVVVSIPAHMTDGTTVCCDPLLKKDWEYVCI